MPRARPTSAASWSSAPGRSSSGRPASSTTPAPRPAGCCAAEGLRVILVNSNPATIMTDPEFADATYVEPITPEFVAKVIEKERPDALLATLGGQTALNTAMALHEAGVLEQVRRRADRRQRRRDPGAARTAQLFKDDRRRASAPSRPAAASATRWTSASRPPTSSATRWSSGRRSRWAAPAPGMAHDEAELRRIAGAGLQRQPDHRGAPRGVDPRLEGVRARADARPARQRRGRLLDREPRPDGRAHRRLDHRRAGDDADRPRVPAAARHRASPSSARSASTPAAATSSSRSTPTTGRIIVIEMNPRVSRSSALASKATGFPIAKIAAKLAIGYTLDEIPNDITRETPASLRADARLRRGEGAAVRVREVPRRRPELTTHMKSSARRWRIGRTFTEALQKALRSLETDAGAAFDWTGPTRRRPPTSALARAARAARRPAVRRRSRRCGRRDRRAGARGDRHRPVVPRPDRAGRRGRRRGRATRPELDRGPAAPGQAARASPTRSSAGCAACREDGVRGVRHALGVRPVYKTVDTCAAEFAAQTPYHYSSYDEETEVAPRDRPAGAHPRQRAQPDRAGHRVRLLLRARVVRAARAPGYETVMVNCNPETVSTDYDTSDRLYFEPLTLEDVLEVVHAEQQAGAGRSASSCSSAGRRRSAWRSGSRTPGVPIVGTCPESIHLAEDRGAFGEVLGRRRPARAQARHRDVATTRPGGSPRTIGYPVLVRPSYVLGGRGMEIVYDDEHAARPTWREATEVSARTTRCWSTGSSTTPSRSTSTRSSTASELYLGGVMEHIEEAGIHSGDSACALPPITLGRDGHRADPRRTPRRIAARRRRARPAQRAVRADGRRALRAGGQPAGQSRTVPFVSKATGGAAGQGGRPGHARRHDRRAARRGPAARRPATAATLPTGRARSRSRRRCCRSSGSAPSRAAASTPARPGDALDRRGHGHRRRLRHGVRQVAGRGVRRAADQGHGLRLGGQPRQAGDDLPGQAAGRPRLRDPRHRGHRRGAAPQRRRGRRSCASTAHGRGPDGEPTVVERILAGEVDLVVNTPSGPRRPRPTATRSARRRSRWTARASPPCRAGRRRAGHRGARPRRARRALAPGAGRAAALRGERDR